jgi:chloride channel protein, CIC family
MLTLNPKKRRESTLKHSFEQESKYMLQYLLKWIFFSTLFGVGGGFLAFFLKYSIRFVYDTGSQLPLWFTPILGGALVSLIFIWDKFSSGFGTNHYIREASRNTQTLPIKTLFPNFLQQPSRLA